MRLWRLGQTKSGGRVKYIAADTSQTQYALHLYRALLRQCSYLPDSAARNFFHNHVVSRFRQYHPPRFISADCRGKRRLQLVKERQPILLKTARKGLLFMQHANDGHPRHLGKVLAMTYGRIGKRRHELLRALRVPDVPSNHAAVQAMSNAASQGLPQPSQQLNALIKAQASKKLSFFSRPNRPSLGPSIPEKNAWGRPMPMKRVRNLKRRWYGQTLDRVMPPLPEDEWTRLRDLAFGKTRWEGPKPRRGSAKDSGFIDEVLSGSLKGGTRFVSRPHQITERYMRRLWAKIFAQCPIMKRDESRKHGWNIRWGEVQGAKEIVLEPGNQDSLAMFQGVDDQGRVLSNA